MNQLSSTTLSANSERIQPASPGSSLGEDNMGTQVQEAVNPYRDHTVAPEETAWTTAHKKQPALGDDNSADWAANPSEDHFQSSQSIPLLPNRQSGKLTFEVLHKWEGVVEEIAADHFLARLYDLKDDTTQEEVELLMKEVSPSDRDLVQVGAFFYLTIGYETKPSGQVQKVFRIRFKRVPPITEEEMDEALDWSNQLQQSINWE